MQQSSEKRDCQVVQIMETYKTPLSSSWFPIGRVFCTKQNGSFTWTAVSDEELSMFSMRMNGLYIESQITFYSACDLSLHPQRCVHVEVEAN